MDICYFVLHARFVVFYLLFLKVFIEYEGTYCAGRHFSTKLMSQNIGSGQNNWFDVRIQEIVSKVLNPGGFLRKNVL